MTGNLFIVGLYEDESVSRLMHHIFPIQQPTQARCEYSTGVLVKPGWAWSASPRHALRCPPPVTRLI